MKPEHKGFLDYVETGKITPAFMDDFHYWCKKLSSGWTLFITDEEFEAICWAALLEQLPDFNPKISTIQTFCISRIRNEILRQWEKNKAKIKHQEVDSDDPVVGKDLYKDDDHLDIDFFYDCKLQGVEINKNEVSLLNEECLITKCFSWIKYKKSNL